MGTAAYWTVLYLWEGLLKAWNASLRPHWHQPYRVQECPWVYTKTQHGSIVRVWLFLDIESIQGIQGQIQETNQSKTSGRPTEPQSLVTYNSPWKKSQLQKHEGWLFSESYTPWLCCASCEAASGSVLLHGDKCSGFSLLLACRATIFVMLSRTWTFTLNFTLLRQHGSASKTQRNFST